MTAVPVIESPTARFERTGSGTTVLCLHGWGASADLFAPFVAQIGPGFDVIIPDLPGFGGTAAPPQPWSVDDYVTWTLAFLDRSGVASVDIVAHSFGARIAIKLAGSHPDRVGRMVLTGAAGLRSHRGVAYNLRVGRFKLLRRLAGTAMLPGGIRKRLNARVERSGSRDYRAAQGTMRGTFVKVVNEDLGDCLSAIRASTLLVWGDHDQETPLSDGRVMAAGIADAGLVIFEGRSHYAYIEEAGRFGQIVRTFLGDPAAAELTDGRAESA